VGLSAWIASWWFNVVLVVWCTILPLVLLDASSKFQRWVARLLSPQDLGQAQPPLFVVDDEGLAMIDSAGQRRAIAWGDVTRVRHATSSSWISGDASLLKVGEPGGRTLVCSEHGALAFDSGIHSFEEMKGLVKRSIPGQVQEERDFATTFRSLFVTWGFIFSGMFMFCGCPAALVLSIEDSAWWVTVVKWLMGAVVGLPLLGFGFFLVWAFMAAAQLRGYIYPRGLAEPPVQERLARPVHYLEEERRSV
jgi:hypothetical protein